MTTPHLIPEPRAGFPEHDDAAWMTEHEWLTYQAATCPDIRQSGRTEVCMWEFRNRKRATLAQRLGRTIPGGRDRAAEACGLLSAAQASLWMASPLLSEVAWLRRAVYYLERGLPIPAVPGEMTDTKENA